MSEDLLVEITTEEIISVSLETADTVAVSVEDTVTASETVVDVISTESSVVTIQTVAAQGPAGPIGPIGNTGPIGPQGPSGPQGISGIQTVNLFSSIPLSGNKVVKITPTGLYYANNLINLDSTEVIGVTQGASIANTVVAIQTFGELDGFDSLTTGQIVYLSTEGSVSHTVPTTGFILKIGTAISSTKINISIGLPIILD